jgi:creatinine amidohydrolase/Fe(II)-dependent formamide hydrolase-like protein
MQPTFSKFSLACGVVLCAMLGSPAGLARAAGEPATVFLEELTSPELRARIAAGATTVLVPIGGTEQNGPHMVLGKHNVRVRALSGQIAQAVGNTVVAPVLAYVPEGAVHPPVAHMRFSGTISIPEPVFEAMLEGAARSFKQHGFRDIFFLGDHGGYQKSQARVAAKLNREWAGDATTRAHALTPYYQVTQTEFVQSLKAQGFSAAEIGTHAGLADTALALAIDPALVRTDMLGSGHTFSEAEGAYGDPRRATAEAGRDGVQRIVDTSVKAIRSAIRSHADH